MWNRVLNHPLVQGQSALHLAVMAGQVRAVQWMVRRGASPDDRDEDGFCALHCAAMHSDPGTAVALLQVLVEAGLPIDTRNGEDGATALHTAAFFGQKRAVRWLLDHGAPLDAQDDDGRTPLMSALSLNNLDVAEVLLQRGANPDARDADEEPILLQSGRTPAHAELLIAKGADLQAVDGDGRNLLHVAALRGDENMVRWALARGVDPTQLDMAGMTPLHALQMEIELIGISELERSHGLFSAGMNFEMEAATNAPIAVDLDDTFGGSLTLLRRHQPGPIAQA